MEGGEARCRALVFGPDKPPDRLGPCRVEWHPVLSPEPIPGSAGALIALGGWVDSVAFTSPRAPRFLYKDAVESGLLEELLDLVGRVRVYAIGPRTRDAVALTLGVEPLLPPRYRGEDLARLIAMDGMRRVVGVRSPDALRDLPRILAESRVSYVEVYSYMVRPCMECLRGVEASPTDYIIATSPMIARLLARRGLRGRYVAIGPSTAETLKGYGLQPHCIPGEYTLAGVAECLTRLEGGE